VRGATVGEKGLLLLGSDLIVDDPLVYHFVANKIVVVVSCVERHAEVRQVVCVRWCVPGIVKPVISVHSLAALIGLLEYLGELLDGSLFLATRSDCLVIAKDSTNG